MRPRSGAIDAVRVLGIIAVVAGHVFENPVVRMALYSWHVPIFFFLTGYFWTAGRTLAMEFSKRSMTLLIPYVIWLVLIAAPFVASLILKGEFGIGEAMRLVLGGSYVGRPFSAFWFVTALFVATLLFRLLERVQKFYQWVIPVVALAVTYGYSESVAAIPFSAGVALPCLIFMLAGFTLKGHRELVRRPLMTGATMIFLATLLILTRLSAPLDLKQADFGTPILSVLVAILVSAGLVLVAESLVPRLGLKTNAWATRIALGGFMVILTHSFFIWILNFLALDNWSVFAISTALPWAAALLLLLTPISPLLLGVPTAKWRRTTPGVLSESPPMA
ncbi:acyltransferase family protein [Arthrobacter sp. TWP1-1]|uniref:acyltransferase family protein n=1 Tax=Arthrobacter sp. TWP1-1 TaxID=2804568 RepID=UPI003CF5F4E4